MATSVYMPQLGLTMTEGTIAKWFKAVGDPINKGEVLVEISTDKITNQLEAPEDGVLLEIVVAEGQVAPVKQLIAVIGAAGEVIETVRQTATERCEETAATVAATKGPVTRPQTNNWIKASPLAKRLAKELGIDLAVVTGTGPMGRVVERDILAFQAENAVKASPLAAKVAAELQVDLAGIKKDGRIMKDDVMTIAAQSGDQTATLAAGGLPIAGMRKVIAERMSLSWNIAPHVNLTMAVDMTAAAELKTNLSKAFGIKFSFTEFIIKCAAHALMEFKLVNSSLVDGKIFEHPSANIGVAVALDNGLIVPVVRDAQAKSIRQLRQEITILSDKARKGELLPDEISGGTFTVTNLGMYGIDQFTPIINQPESAILGVCRIVDTPVVLNNEIMVRPMMNLCLSIDHRLIDGALGAQFLARVKALLEQPLLLL